LNKYLAHCFLLNGSGAVAAVRAAALPVILALVISGCDQNSRSEGERTLIDRAGGQVSLSAGLDRIVSTAPSNTEIIIALGLGDRLAAVDKYSGELAGITGTPALIDFVYPDAELIIALNPGIIIASGHNQTVSGDDPFKLVREAGIPVVYIPTSDSIEGIYEDIRFIAEVLQCSPRGAELIAQMKEEVEAIARTGAAVSPKKSVYFEISPFPFMVSCGQGTYLNQMMEIIGAENIFAAEKGWFSPAAEAVIDRNPDVILILDYAGVPGASPLDEIKNRAGFETMDAVKNNEIYAIDADSASRPSPRITLALGQMARAVYPDVYEKNH
jgi:iron complex transport system substrate-binding protein